MKYEFSIQDLLEETVKEDQRPINLSDSDTLFNSSVFSEQKSLLKSIVNVESPSKSSFKAVELKTTVPSLSELIKIGSDNVIIYSGWKNTENVSARLIDFYNEIVILECLVDRDQKIYEEREFKASLFSEFDIKIGDLFYLRMFDRKNEIRLEVHNDPNLTFQEDFPSIDFKELFMKSKLFKK